MITDAAIKRDGKIYTGRRHCEIIEDMVLNHDCEIPIKVDEQGFIDDKGEFYSRFKALQLAKRSGQIPLEFNKKLLSEDLW